MMETDSELEIGKLKLFSQISQKPVRTQKVAQILTVCYSSGKAFISQSFNNDQFFLAKAKQMTKCF